MTKVTRHFEGEEFPEQCDHCPAELGPGVAYRRIQMVLDACDSLVGGPRSVVENSFELVLCSACAARIEYWVHHPLSIRGDEEDAADELDDQALLAELAKEEFILGDGPAIEPDVTKWRNVSTHPVASEGSGGPGGGPIFEIPERCPLHQNEDFADLACFACHQLVQARAQRAASQEPPPLSRAETALREVLRQWGSTEWNPDPKPEAPGSPKPSEAHGVAGRSPKPCLDPDLLHGAGDQFPGDDHHMLGKKEEPS